MRHIISVLQLTLVVLTAWVLAACSGTSAEPKLSLEPAKKQKPNVLIFLADDLTYNDIGVYGNKDVKTPNLDKFAQNAVKFNQTYSTAAMCAPTRMELYTGVQPLRNGAHANHSKVHEHIKSFPHYLKPDDYRVALIGKGHIGPRPNFPFDYIERKKRGKNETIHLEPAQELIEETENPWMLVVASYQPHGPWNLGTPEAYDPASFTVPDYLIDTPELREDLRKYYAEIEVLDQQFANVISFLDKQGNDRDTLIIFLSEQGSSMPFAKWTLYEHGTRAAMMMGWHKAKTKGVEDNSLIQYADILPTILEITGQDVSKLDIDGKSFAGLLDGTANAHRKYVYGTQTTRGIYYGTNYPVRSIRSDKYQLMWNINHEGKFKNGVINSNKAYKSWLSTDQKERAMLYQKRPEFELYDVNEDPNQLNNLAGKPELKAIQEQMFADLQVWLKQQGDEGMKTEEAVENVLTRRAAQKEAEKKKKAAQEAKKKAKEQTKA